MKIRTAIIIAAAFAALLIAPTSGATPAESCDLGFPERTPSVVAPGIYGVVWADCTIPPDRHVMRVSLEKRLPDGSWQAASRLDGNPIDDDRIPNPRVTYRVEVLCEPGAWRITANATGNLRGISFNFTDHSAVGVISGDQCRG